MKEPFVVHLGASNHSLVRGCPGVPKTCPRVESVLEIRSTSGNTFAINTIILELNTVQSASIPTNGGLSTNDIVKAYNVYKNVLYKKPKDSDAILGMDLPFIIPLNKDIVSSGKNLRWNAKTVHNLTVRVGWWNHDKLEAYSTSFPLIIKRYDTLPLYRQFNELVTKTVESPDNNFFVEYSLPNSSVGPKDELNVYMKIFANPNVIPPEQGKRRSFIKRKPLKLRKIQFELREIFECHDCGTFVKQTKLMSKQQEFDSELGSSGVTTQISFEFPNDVKNIINNSSSNAVNSSQLKLIKVDKDTAIKRLSTLRQDSSALGGFKNSNPAAPRNSESSIRKSFTWDPSVDADKSDTSFSSSEDLKPTPTIQSTPLMNANKTFTTNTKILDEVNAGVPLTHMQGFSSQGKLFSIKYEIVFKIKLTNSQPVKFSHPITVSPYDRVNSVKLVKWIMKEWELARFINNTTFQTNFNNEKVNYINSLTLENNDPVNSEVFRASVNFNRNSSSEKFSKFLRKNSMHQQNYYDYTIGALRPGAENLEKEELTIYQSKPFHVYKPQNRLDWKLLGLSEKPLGSYGKSFIHYID